MVKVKILKNRKSGQSSKEVFNYSSERGAFFRGGGSRGSLGPLSASASGPLSVDLQGPLGTVVSRVGVVAGRPAHLAGVPAQDGADELSLAVAEHVAGVLVRGLAVALAKAALAAEADAGGDPRGRAILAELAAHCGSVKND